MNPPMNEQLKQWKQEARDIESGAEDRKAIAEEAGEAV